MTGTTRGKGEGDFRSIEFANCRISIPSNWDAIGRDDQAMMVCFDAVEARNGFRATMTLTVDPAGDGAPDDADERLAASLAGYQLIEREACALSGRDGVRRLAQHVTETGIPVTMEQWTAGSYTLTATVDTWRYVDFADLFLDLASRFRLPEQPTGTTAP